MSDLLQGVLFFATIAFSAGMLFRLWWVAALIAMGGLAMFWPRSDAVNLAGLAIPALMIGLPAFEGAALGKLIIQAPQPRPVRSAKLPTLKHAALQPVTMRSNALATMG